MNGIHVKPCSKIPFAETCHIYVKPETSHSLNVKEEKRRQPRGSKRFGEYFR